MGAISLLNHLLLKHIRAIYVGSSPPQDSDLIWLDTSNNVFRRYVNGQWIPITGGSSELIVVSNLIISNTEPEDTSKLWFDTTTHKIKYFNGSDWVSIDVDTIKGITINNNVDVNSLWTSDKIKEELVKLQNQIEEKADKDHTHHIDDITGLDLSEATNVVISNESPKDTTKLWFDTQSKKLKYYDQQEHIWKSIDVDTIKGITVDNDANSNSLWTSDKIISELTTKADLKHIHEISEVNGLQEALDSKAEKQHTHSINDLIDYVPSIHRSENTPNRTDVFWYDTSTNQMKYYSTEEGTWKTLDKKSKIVISTEKPNDTSLLWFDLNTKQLKYYNGHDWVSIDVETIKGITVDNSVNSNSLWTSDKIRSELDKITTKINEKADQDHTHKLEDIVDYVPSVIRDTTAPSDTSRLWFDENEKQLKYFDHYENTWKPINVNATYNVIISGVEPEDKTKLWFRPIDGKLRYYNGQEWVSIDVDTIQGISIDNTKDSDSLWTSDKIKEELDKLQNQINEKADKYHTHSIEDIIDYRPSVYVSDIAPEPNEKILWLDTNTKRLKYYDTEEGLWKPIVTKDPNIPYTEVIASKIEPEDKSVLWLDLNFHSLKYYDEQEQKWVPLRDIQVLDSRLDILENEMLTLSDLVQNKLDKPLIVRSNYPLEDTEKLWYDTNEQRTKFYNGTEWQPLTLPAIYVSDTMPNVTDVLWYDTSRNQLKYYDLVDKIWKQVGITDTTGHIEVSDIAPTDTNKLWFDTNTKQLKYYNGQQWISIDVATINGIPVNNNSNSNSLWTSDKILSVITSTQENKADKYHTHSISDITDYVPPICIGNSAPQDTSILWFDTNDKKLKYYDHNDNTWKAIGIEYTDTDTDTEPTTVEPNVIISNVEPNDTSKLWFDTNTKQLKYYNGQEWVPIDVNVDVNVEEHTHTLSDIVDYKPQVVISDTAPQDTSVLWFDTNTKQLKYYDEQEWKPIDTETNVTLPLSDIVRLVYVSDQPPTTDIETYVWLDTSTNTFKYFKDGVWYTLQEQQQQGQQQEQQQEQQEQQTVLISQSPPTDTNILWFDTSSRQLKYYNGQQWVPIEIKPHNHSISDIVDYKPPLVTGSSAPQDTSTLWFDTNLIQLKYYHSETQQWIPVLGSEHTTVIISDTEPIEINKLWFDTNTKQLKYYSSQGWKSIDAETIKGITIDNNANSGSLWTSDKIRSELQTIQDMLESLDVSQLRNDIESLMASAETLSNELQELTNQLSQVDRDAFAVTISENAPERTDILWYNPNTHMLKYYDEQKGKWLPIKTSRKNPEHFAFFMGLIGL